MSFLSRLLTSYRHFKAAFGQRAVYRSPIDLYNAARCRGRTVARPGVAGAGGEITLGVRGLPDPVHCRLDSSDFLVFREIFEEGEYGQVSKWGLPPNATLVDLGGNIGLATLYFSIAHPQLRAVVVEPDEENCRMIQQNCRALIEHGQVRVIPAFAAAHEGSAEIDRSGRSWAFKKVESPAAGASSQSIPCVSMPSLLTTAAFDEVDLLKCDIEGSERELFADCSQWVGRVKHMIVETHAPYTSENLYEDLRRAGWNYELLAENKSPNVTVSAMRRAN